MKEERLNGLALLHVHHDKDLFLLVEADAVAGSLTAVAQMCRVFSVWRYATVVAIALREIEVCHWISRLNAGNQWRNYSIDGIDIYIQPNPRTASSLQQQRPIIFQK